jgi:hypothetical protein
MAILRVTTTQVAGRFPRCNVPDQQRNVLMTTWFQLKDQTGWFA